MGSNDGSRFARRQRFQKGGHCRRSRGGGRGVLLATILRVLLRHELGEELTNGRRRQPPAANQEIKARSVLVRPSITA